MAPRRPDASALQASALTGLPPVFDDRARVLILGSFPGVASLAARAYYAHPRNQFWPILSAILGTPLATMAYAARLEAIRAHRVAVWDVVDRCRRAGSLDTAIRDAIANDFDPLLAHLPALAAVAFNGRLAARSRPWFAGRGYETIVLPSTSPAHAGMDFARKLAAWQQAIAPLLASPPGGLPPDAPAGDPGNRCDPSDPGHRCAPVSASSPRRPAPD